MVDDGIMPQKQRKNIRQYINAISHSIEFTVKYEEPDKQEKKPIEELVPPAYHKYLKVFSEQAANRLPERKAWEHKIDMKPDFIPKSSKIYPLNPEEEWLTKEFIDEHLAKGTIRKSTSPQASPFFFVNKKDRKKLPCQDYRYVNGGTIKNAYPLPLVSDLLDNLKGAKHFTKFDVRWGYNNIRIRSGDEWKAAFKTKFGLFKPTVMFFRLCNSPATFQSIMDSLFDGMKTRNAVIVYMDDILIFAETEEELEKYTNKVLQILQDNDLYLKPEKCEFNKTSMKYLGFVITPGKIEMDLTKLRGITEWPAPRNLRQLRSFLGFGNFYQRFIHHYSNLTKPLNELLQKKTKWNWSPRQEDAFVTLKEWFASEPVLMMPDQGKPFILECDASKYASGAILSQMDQNGEKRPVAFLPNHSIKLNEITKYMTENYWQLSEPLKNGDIIFKEDHSLSRSILTTEILATFANHRN